MRPVKGKMALKQMTALEKGYLENEFILNGTKRQLGILHSLRKIPTRCASHAPKEADEEAHRPGYGPASPTGRLELAELLVLLYS
jgi:hypothetical protein